MASRGKQRSLVNTFLDVKKEFREAHDNLIPEVLEYHHIPLHIQTIIGNLYSNFRTSIITKSLQTPVTTVGKGVLQGDSLGPLIFKICFTTFTKYISDPKFTQFGSPQIFEIHCISFTLPTTQPLLSAYMMRVKIMLNHFSRWCTLGDIIMRIDKCSSFGIRKSAISSVQFLPKLINKKDLVPTVKFGESFKYLGRYFSFAMQNSEHSTILLDTTTNLLNKIDNIPCIQRINFYFTIVLFCSRSLGIFI